MKHPRIFAAGKLAISLSARTALAGTLFCMSHFLGAQTMKISPKLAVETALRNNTAVIIANEGVTGAAAYLDEAEAQRLPKVELTGRAVQLSDVDQGTISIPFLPGSPSIALFPVIRHSYAARMSVNQPLFTGYRLSGAIASAEKQVEAARSDRIRTEHDLTFEVEKAFWNWVELREGARVLGEASVQMGEHERLVQRMGEQGLATRSDVLQVKVRRSDVEVQAIEMRSRAATAQMRLNFLMGYPLQTELEPDMPDVRVRPALSTDTASVDMALQTRPDVRAAISRVEASASGVDIARSGWYPTVALAAAYEYSNPNQRVIPPRDAFDGSWEVGVTLRWTVWDWSATGHQTEQAAARLRQAEARLENIKDGVRLEVFQSDRQCKDAQESLRSAQLAREAAEEAYRVSKELFDKGAGRSVDVTDARVDVLRARLSETRATAALAIADAQLRRAKGE